MSVFPASQNKRRALYRTALFGLGGLLALLAIASRLLQVEVHLFAIVIMVAVYVLSVLQFNALDEVAKQAHYVAWYWGGMFALVVVAVATVAETAFPRMEAPSLAEMFLPLWGGANDIDGAFMAGFLSGPALMVIGFTAWWLVYWLRRR